MHFTTKPNHLATTIDSQRSAATSLPESLMRKCIALNKLTEELKTIIDNGLPTDILNTLWVVHYEAGKMTISVPSYTAANHLRYQADNLVNILSKQSFTFHQLKHIDVIVTHFNSDLSHSKNTNLNETNYRLNNTNRDLTNRGLNETTKRTIAYTNKHVITDKRLKSAIERLIKP